MQTNLQAVAHTATHLSFAVETLDVFLREALPLFTLHWQEIATHKDIPLQPDFNRYFALEAAGGLRIYTARVDSKLVGYSVFIVSPHAHYADSIQAIQDVIFVHPENRLGRIGLKLIKYSEDKLRSDHVQVVVHHVKNTHPALGRLLDAFGYKPVETIYSKRLD